ncbi:N-acetyl-gamma-glutamyl-phosphate reductase [Polymorphobacter fuscus]|uniref:N-acetyl-gamma-glutamyl-phosphate reductase n=1 Tax=Sandarakinorhabdus fusca TaxID=1439888 RepID=A0A7C9GSJ2_9SPHN|nr:N-acetyl-gamma-glutamyl-phosphate reductase [Polymorphobacter fuscus]KAB7648306.1 N-acetyl-gamma-glutamyl-phosphate reductase [Polymorphobacter fuscus]MQT15818.1 N-acetyl-gamma-glutamyl-phosphate reductase [Polymorphobacter fuscus]NJC07908.1 N-acetyl-gamma-glutamyl-phosphate reductase [Polymorphobacter fuscus]
MTSPRPLRIAVLGASGYTGADLVRLALTHPRIEIAALSANAKAGQTMAQVWPHFAPYPDLPRLVAAEAIDYAGIDAVFGCLPHAASAALLGTLKGPRIIDLSADFRLKDADVYASWYGGAHPAPQLLSGAVYGLTEFARDALPGAGLVACPGCYPTAVLLALLPLVGAGAVSPANITVNALSGVSGSGRSLKEANLFTEVAEAVHPYGIGAHRHMPEMEQQLAAAAGAPVTISFTPHLVPMNRGELVTCIVEATRPIGDLRAILAARYAAEPFVHLLPEGVAPATRMVRGSNHVVVNVFADRIPGRAIVIAAIDNLVKGSSGQAMQNFNLMFGLPETMGLEAAPLFP